MLRKFRRTVNQLIRRDLLSQISKALFICEEGFFTEWKLGNTPNKKPRDPAFGGVFFCLCIKKEPLLNPLPPFTAGAVALTATTEFHFNSLGLMHGLEFGADRPLGHHR